MKVGGVLTKMKTRIRNNQNNIVFFVGEVGSGKSYSALKLAETLDPTFSVDRCVFRAEDFMDLIDKGRLKKGQAIIWDECGIEMDARDFWTTSNKLISYTLESFRFMNINLIMTVPSLSFVDVKLRKLVHFLVETIRVYPKEEKVLCKVFRLQHSPRSQSQKVYQKYIRLAGSKLTKTRFGKPSEEVIQQYEEKKRKFLRKMYREIAAELKHIRKKETSKRFDLDVAVQEVLKDRKKYLKTYNQRTYIDIRKIMTEYNVGTRRADQIKQIVESKMKL